MSTAGLTLPDNFDTEPPLTQVERVSDTFFAPSKTFTDIRRDRSWWLPFLLLTVFSYLFTGVLMHRLGPAGIVDSALRANPAKYEQFKNLPAEQQATQRHFIGIATTASLYSAPVLQIAVAALLALLLGCLQFPAWRRQYLSGHVRCGLLCVAARHSSRRPGQRHAFSRGQRHLQPAGSGRNQPRLLPVFRDRAMAACAARLVRPVHAVDALSGRARRGHRRPRQSLQRLRLVFGIWFLYVLVKVGIAAATS